jgi:hypothetical protein
VARDHAARPAPEFPLGTSDSPPPIDGAAIDALVKEIPLREAFFYSEAFRRRSQASEPNDPWRLLDLVFSLQFWLDNDRDPLGPLSKISPENVALLRLIFFESQDAEIRSRLGDVLWLVTGDRHAMEVAIDAYLESGLRLEDPAHWGHAIRRYQRAAGLVRDLKRKSSLRKRVSDFVLDRVRYYEGKDPYYFTQQALELLLMLRIGDPQELYRHAIVAAESAEAHEDSGRSRACYMTAEKAARWEGDEAGVILARTAIARTWIEQAERLEEAGDFLTVRYVWKRAILAYRRLGNETKAAELRPRLKNAKRIGRRQIRSLSVKERKE